MQYDNLNKIDFKRTFLTHHGKELLNLSWISFGLISKFMTLKEEHPFLERIMTRPRLFNRHGIMRKKFAVRAADYFLKSMIYYPWRYLADPTYTFPWGLLKEFMHRMKRSHWEVDKVIHVFKRHKRRTLLSNKIYVLGHVHDKYVEDKNGVIIVHPGSWRDEYKLDKKNRLIPVVKRYVQILISDSGHESQLIDVPIKRSVLNFNQVVKDELKYIQLAAEEEGFGVKI